VTFNVRNAEISDRDDGAHAWRLRRRALVDALAGYAADVACLQEASSAQAAEVLAGVRAAAGGAAAWGAVSIGCDDGRAGGETATVLFRADRWALAAPPAAFWLSPTPDAPGSVGWGASLPRLAAVVRLAERADGGEGGGGGGAGGAGPHPAQQDPAAGPDPPGAAALAPALDVFCTHLDHESAAAREEGVRLIRARMAALAAGGGGAAPAVPAVLLGDFNAGPDSAAAAAAAAPAGGDAGLVDALAAADPAGHAAHTLHLFRGVAPAAGAGRERLDFVLASAGPGGVAVDAAWVDRERHGEPPVWTSDHFPVIADLRWHAAGAGDGATRGAQR